MTVPLGGSWIFDSFTADDLQAHRISRTIVTARTKYQQVEILENDTLGRFLVLDGKMQSAESDESIYHEALVHPAMVSHERPRSVLILGGGEGATLREALRYRTVDRVTMVDIDAELVDLCRRHLTRWHQGAFENPRTKLLCMDAWQFLAETPDRFDVIVSDVTDLIDEGLASDLYTEDFYRLVDRCLSPGGYFSSQALSIRFATTDRLHAAIHHTLRLVFPTVWSYTEFVPSFDSLWGFVLATKQPGARQPSAATVADRLNAQQVGGLSYFDSTTFDRLFALPGNLRDLLGRSQQTLRRRQPPA